MNEIATSTVEGDEALSRLPIARRLIQEKKEQTRKSEIEELKSKYRKLKNRRWWWKLLSFRESNFG